MNTGRRGNEIFVHFYQLDKDASVYKRFAGWDELQRIGKFDWKDYKVVYAGTVEAANETDACETLYQKFNVGKKPLCYHGTSMSVSDIVKLTDENRQCTLWYCDNIGFKEIDL